MRKDILELMDDVAGLIEWLKADLRRKGAHKKADQIDSLGKRLEDIIDGLKSETESGEKSLRDIYSLLKEISDEGKVVEFTHIDRLKEMVDRIEGADK